MSEADSFDWLPALLVLQGLLGIAPQRRVERSGRVLRAAREALYAALFLAFAWWAWQGALAAVVGALLAAALVIAVSGHLDRLRTLNLGAVSALLAPALLAWSAHPTGLAPAHHGWMSWALTLFAALAAAFALRHAAFYPPP